MRLNELGKIAEQEWLKTPSIRPDMNLELGEFIVMPNHFHGIIYIGNNKYNSPHQDDGDDRRDGRDAMHDVSTHLQFCSYADEKCSAITGQCAGTGITTGTTGEIGFVKQVIHACF